MPELTDKEKFTLQAVASKLLNISESDAEWSLYNDYIELVIKLVKKEK